MTGLHGGFLSHRTSSMSRWDFSWNQPSSYGRTPMAMKTTTWRKMAVEPPSLGPAVALFRVCLHPQRRWGKATPQLLTCRDHQRFRVLLFSYMLYRLYVMYTCILYIYNMPAYTWTWRSCQMGYSGPRKTMCRASSQLRLYVRITICKMRPSIGATCRIWHVIYYTCISYIL